MPRLADKSILQSTNCDFDVAEFGTFSELALPPYLLIDSIGAGYFASSKIQQISEVDKKWNVEQQLCSQRTEQENGCCVRII